MRSSVFQDPVPALSYHDDHQNERSFCKMSGNGGTVASGYHSGVDACMTDDGAQPPNAPDPKFWISRSGQLSRSVKMSGFEAVPLERRMLAKHSTQLFRMPNSSDAEGLAAAPSGMRDSLTRLLNSEEIKRDGVFPRANELEKMAPRVREPGDTFDFTSIKSPATTITGGKLLRSKNLNPGDIFGEVAFFTQTPSQVGVEVVCCHCLSQRCNIAEEVRLCAFKLVPSWHESAGRRKRRSRLTSAAFWRSAGRLGM